MRGPGLSRKLMALHEHTALAGLIAIAVHGVTLLGDSWLRPGVAGVAVPFVLDYKPFFTGLGIIAGYLAVLLGLSFYLRQRIGAKLWRKAHRATVAVWVLGLVHAIGAGSDATAIWFRWWVIATTPLIGGLLVARVLESRAPKEAAAPAKAAVKPAARPQASTEPVGVRPLRPQGDKGRTPLERSPAWAGSCGAETPEESPCLRRRHPTDGPTQEERSRQ